MLRIVAATYLMLVTLAGPCLCCCAPGRLAAFFSKRSNEAPSAPARPACCCEHSEPCPQSDPAGPPERPQPTRPSCPCQDRPDCSALALPPLSEVTRQALAGASEAPGDLFAHPAFHDTPAADVCLPIARALRALPFLTTDDLLHALHVLRC